MSSTKSENIKKRKPDVFERLSVDKKKIENVTKPHLVAKKHPRKSNIQGASITNLSKSKFNGGVPQSAQNRRLEITKLKKESSDPSISEKLSSLNGKLNKSEANVEKISEKSRLENVPENVNKDSEDEKRESSYFSDSKNLNKSQDLSIGRKTNDLDTFDVYYSRSSSHDDAVYSPNTVCGDRVRNEEEVETTVPELWIVDEEIRSTPNNVNSDNINNDNHLSKQSSTKRYLTSKEILREIKGNNLKKVDDQDKDVCDDDKLYEDDEFYKIKVQTRLVSYENSTLVIRNTSKRKADSTAGSETDGEENVSSNHDSFSLSSSASLHSSSSELTMLEEGADILTNGDAVESTETRSSSLSSLSVRSKLGQYVTKGKLILSDVRNSSYMPDVKTPLSKLQNVTRRSFRSMLTYSPTVSLSSRHSEDRKRENGEPSCFNSSLGQEYSHSGVRLKSEDCRKSTNKKLSSSVSTDTMESNPGNIQSGMEPSIRNNVCSLTQESPTEPSSSTTIDLVRIFTNTIIMEDGMENSNRLSRDLIEQQVTKITLAGSEKDSQELPRKSTTCSDFFSSCYCSGFATANRIPTQQEATLIENCSCKQESELPLEIREILDCDHARMWWTITGNFGNILPIDWSKTYTRQKYLPVLNLNEAKKLDGAADSLTPSPRVIGQDDEDEVAHDLDLHQLILAGAQTESEPVKSAEEVIKEIDDIMQEGSSSEDEGIDASSSESNSNSQHELRKLPPPLYFDKLKELNLNELNETVMELEAVIRQYSETLIAQLAHRDELEYEKELKNTFISLLLQVQNKRRNYNVEKKRIKKPLGQYGTEPKYLTTVIPYDVGHGPPHNQTILMLIKILTAINGDIPTVPTLLTDYILKVLCPSTC